MEQRPADHVSSRSPSDVSSGSKISRGSSDVSSSLAGRRGPAAASGDGQGGLIDLLMQAQNSEREVHKDSQHRGVPPIPDDSLATRLALAQHELRDDSAAHSSGADSEERDSLWLAQQVEHEIESRSNSGSMVDSNDGTSKLADKEATAAATAAAAASSSENTGDKVVELRQAMEDISEQHEESIQSPDPGSLIQRISHLEQSHETAKAALEKTAEEALRAKKLADDKHGEVLDKMAGVHARMQVQVENIKAEFTEKAAAAHEDKKRALQALELTEVSLKSENVSLEQKLKTTALTAKQIIDERDVLRRNMQAMQHTYKTHVGTLKEQLVVANQALKREAGSDSDNEPSTDESSSSASSKKKPEVSHLQEQLAHAHETQRAMTDELSELRLQVLDLKQEKPAHTPVVGDLTMMLTNADVRLQDALSDTSGGGRGAGRGAALGLSRQLRVPTRMGGKGRGRLGRPAMSLACIEEDTQSMDDASCDATGNVSSDGGGELVGNMDDFEDYQTQSNDGKRQQDQEYEKKIECLEEKLVKDSADLMRVKEELADKEAAHASKVDRLMETLYTTKSTAEDQLETIRAEFAENDRHRQEHMEELQAMLGAAQRRCELVQEEHATLRLQAGNSAGQREHELESLRHQLACALEGKRIAEGRVDELNRAMASMERQHKQVMAGLKPGSISEQACKTSGSEVSGSCSSKDEVDELRHQLRNSVEERNVLANSLEWKEVQWKSRVENMEMQQGVEVSELKRRHDTEMKELQRKLEGELADVRQQLTDAQSRPVVQECAVPASASSSGPMAWLANLRCPVRNLPGNLSGSPDGAAFCQEICWRILNTVQGIIALLCNSGNYMIVEATRAACVTWGSAALQGQSVLTLVNGPSRAAWLRKAFQMHQTIADSSSDGNGIPGFVVRDLGCEEFTSKTGQAFDSSVITAHLPAEPRFGKQPALLVIIQPQGVTKGGVPQQQAAHQPQPAPRIEQGARAGGGADFSAQSEVSSVHPDDSASNIFG